jgi:hypothetical protein
MPYALCPMPYALCPIVPHLSEKGYSWYSGVENLKFLINQKLGFIFGI